MAKKFLPSEFNQKAEFGTVETVENEYTGAEQTVFKSQLTLHIKPQSRTINQQYLATQSGLSDTQIIVIRHNPKVTETMLVKLGGVVYNIVSINPDDVFGFGKYDYVTIRKNSKVGK